MPLMIIGYFDFLLLIELIFVNCIFLGNSKHLNYKDN